MRPRYIPICLLFLLLFRADFSFGQAIDIHFRDVALGTAIHELKNRAGIDVVYAENLVSGKKATCEYRGIDATEAVRCVLRESGLRAAPVRRKQYVLLPPDNERIEPTAAVNPIPRGLLSGFVADRATGEKLPGANVFIPDLRLGAATNNAGYFAIPNLPLGRYPVRITYLGYHPKDTTLTVGVRSSQISLDSDTYTATEVLVEAPRNVREDLASIPGVLALEMPDMKKMLSFPGEQDLFTALQWQPGIHRSGEVTGGLVIRGGEPDQNLYLIDGVPIYHPWHAFSLISTFQTETFKDVRMYRGSFPAEHGGRLASVLDAQLKDGSQTDTHFEAALSLLSARFLLESPIGKKSSFMVSGRRSYIDALIGREHPVENEAGVKDTLRTGYYFYDVSFKYSYRPNIRHQISFSHYRGKDKLDLRLPFNLSLDLSSWLQPANLFFEIGQDWKNELYSGRHHFLVTPRLFLTNTAYFSKYRAFEDTFIQPTTSAYLESDYRVRLHDFGFRSDADYYLGLSHQLRGGVQVVNHRFWSSLQAEIQRSVGAVDSLDQFSRVYAWELVGYLQDHWQPSPRWQVLPGIRVSRFSTGGYLNVMPQLSARYALRPGRVSARAALGTQVQYLQHLRDRYSFMYDLVSSRWIPASASVEPATSFQTGLGVDYIPNPWLVVNLDAYYRYSRGILLPRDEYRTKDGLEGPGIEVGTLLGQYTRAQGQYYGAEMMARLERGDWQIWANGSISRSLNRAPDLGERKYRPSRYDAPLGLKVVAVKSLKHWTFTLAADSRSGYPYSAPVARYQIADPLDPDPADYVYRPSINNGRLPPYWRIDAAAGFRFGIAGAVCRLQLQFYNVLNHRNVINREYDPEDTVVRPVESRSLPMLPLFEMEISL